MTARWIRGLSLPRLLDVSADPVVVAPADNGDDSDESEPWVSERHDGEEDIGIGDEYVVNEEEVP